jgi:phosphohistidine phosphatase SixA
MSQGFKCFLLFLVLALASCSTTHYYVVRHGERLNNTDDSPLSEAGFRRADALRDLMTDKRIGVIFVSDKIRTQQTVRPTAELFDLEPIVIPKSETDHLIADIKDIYGKSVLVVRHSEELDQIVNALSPSDTIEPIGNEFDNLFVVRRQIYFWQIDTFLQRLKDGE